MQKAPYVDGSESLAVVYGGSLQIPIAIGSIAVPLDDNGATQTLPEGGTRSSRSTLNKSRRGETSRSATTGTITGNRYTHRRYCYLRDGSDLAEDCFYRWLLVNTTGTGSVADEAPNNDAERKRARKESEGASVKGEEGALHQDSKAGHESKETLLTSSSSFSPACPSGGSSAPPSALTPKSPSLLYSFIDHVEFVVPSSFPRPRRIIRTPPFVVEDDTWAEHLVEIHVHFLPHLGIPPASLMHQVLLQHRVPGLPMGLLARTQGTPKPTPMVLLAPAPGEPSPSTPAHTKEEVWWSTQCAAVIVSERQDALRVLHPSWPVVEHFRRALAKQAHPLMTQLRAYFEREVYRAPREVSGSAEKRGEIGEKENLTSATGAAAATTRPVVTVHTPALPFSALPALLAAAMRNSNVATPHHFLLPKEACLLDHIQTREQRCIAALEETSEALQAEQEEMCAGIEASLEAMHDLAVALKEKLDSLHSVCVHKLGSKESLTDGF